MKIGYARVSTHEQNLDLQIDALKKEGCEKIFEEKVSGSKTDRPELTELIKYIRPGDILVIWKLDRLGRSLKHLIDLVSELQENGIGLKSLKESIDTSTASGKLIFSIFGALAEFERDIIIERTLAGLAAARARGRLGGRRKSLNDKEVEMLKMLSKDRNVPIKDICKRFNISRASYYNYLSK